MKRIALGFTMFVAAAAVFASGVPENDDWNRGSYRMSESAEVSMTGTYTEDETGAYLNTSDGVYSLSAPGYRRQEIDLESGETIAVEGLLIDCSGEGVRDADGHLMVERATIDGTVYEASRGPRNMPRQPGNRVSGRPMAGRGARPVAPQDGQFGPQGRRF